MRKLTSDAMTLPTEVGFREPQLELGTGQELPVTNGSFRQFDRPNSPEWTGLEGVVRM
jgi:hypothetical protein